MSRTVHSQAKYHLQHMYTHKVPSRLILTSVAYKRREGVCGGSTIITFVFVEHVFC